MAEKVVDSVHSPDGMYCVDVIRTGDGFTLRTCRRDEGSWQIIEQLGEYQDQSIATAAAKESLLRFQ